MSKQKTRQRKNSKKQTRSTTQRHEHQVAVEAKHHPDETNWKNLIIAFFIYLLVFTMITAFIDWWVGDIFDAPLVYLIPLGGAIVMTIIHHYQGWKLPSH